MVWFIRHQAVRGRSSRPVCSRRHLLPAAAAGAAVAVPWLPNTALSREQCPAAKHTDHTHADSDTASTVYIANTKPCKICKPKSFR